MTGFIVGGRLWITDGTGLVWFGLGFIRIGTFFFFWFVHSLRNCIHGLHSELLLYLNLLVSCMVLSYLADSCCYSIETVVPDPFVMPPIPAPQQHQVLQPHPMFLPDFP